MASFTVGKLTLDVVVNVFNARMFAGLAWLIVLTFLIAIFFNWVVLDLLRGIIAFLVALAAVIASAIATAEDK